MTKREALLHRAQMAYETLTAHRANHGCRGQACEEAQRLRSIWSETDEKAEISR